MNIDLRLLLSPAIYLVLSWFKFLWTGSVQVDDNFISNYCVNVGFYFISFFDIILSFYLFRKVWISGFSGSWFQTNVMLAIICLLSLPLYSSDIFSILSFGSEELVHTNVYRELRMTENNIYYSYVYKMYRSTPCVYGPLNLLIAKVSNVSTKDVFINFWVIKFVFFGFHMLCIYVLNQLKRVKSELFYNKGINFFLFFPLVWMQGWIQLHNEAIALVFVVLAVLSLYRYSNLLFAAIFISLAVLTKITFVVFYFLILVYIIQNRINLSKVILPIVVSIGCILGGYALYIDRLSDIFLPFKTLQEMSTHGSIKDVVSSIMSSSNLLHKILLSFDLFILLYIVFVIVRFGKLKLFFSIQFLLVFLTVFFTIYSHRLFPWYLLTIAIPFLYHIKNQEQWNVFLFFISCFYCLQDLSVQIPHETIWFHINVGLTTALGVGSIFLFFKGRLLAFKYMDYI
ncbi:MAG: hypothetical protein ACOVP5_02025 [Chitinophagales bacterium]